MTSKNALYYGNIKQTRKSIFLDRRKLSDPNGFILGCAGSGKTYAAKSEIITSFLETKDNILIISTGLEYLGIAKTFGGEIITLSENQGILNPPPKAKNEQSRITIYDMSNIEVNTKIKEGISDIFFDINSRIQKNYENGIKTRVYFDELFWILKDSQSTKAFLKLYKNSIKYRCIVTGVTQNTEFLIEDNNLRDTLYNADFVILFKQGKKDGEKLSVIFGLSPEMAEYLTRSESGSGVIYAREKFGAVSFKSGFFLLG